MHKEKTKAGHKHSQGDSEHFTPNEVKEIHRKVDEILDKISKLEELQVGQDVTV